MPYIILGVLLHHAPNGSAQAKMVKVYHQEYLNVIATFEVNRSLEYEKILVAMLHEGLSADIWPWDDEPSTTDPTTTRPTWGPWGEKGREGL